MLPAGGGNRVRCVRGRPSRTQPNSDGHHRPHDDRHHDGRNNARVHASKARTRRYQLTASKPMGQPERSCNQCGIRRVRGIRRTVRIRRICRRRGIIVGRGSGRGIGRALGLGQLQSQFVPAMQQRHQQLGRSAVFLEGDKLRGFGIIRDGRVLDVGKDDRRINLRIQQLDYFGDACGIRSCRAGALPAGKYQGRDGCRGGDGQCCLREAEDDCGEKHSSLEAGSRYSAAVQHIQERVVRIPSSR